MSDRQEILDRYTAKLQELLPETNINVVDLREEGYAASSAEIRIHFTAFKGRIPK